MFVCLSEFLCICPFVIFLSFLLAGMSVCLSCYHVVALYSLPSYLSICLSVCLPSCPSISFSICYVSWFVRLSLSSFVFVYSFSSFMPVCLSDYLFAFLYFFPSFIYVLSVGMSVYLSVFPSFISVPSVGVSVYLSFSPTVPLYFCITVSICSSVCLSREPNIFLEESECMCSWPCVQVFYQDGSVKHCFCTPHCLLQR